MIQGLYAAATGMMAVESRLAVIANNIANVATPGFKRQIAVQTGFYEVFLGKSKGPQRLNAERAPGGGLKVTETFTNYSNGIITTTGNPLDLALLGPGMLAVDTPEGERFTRNGRLSVGGQGQLITSNGLNVLGTNGAPITVGGGQARIDREGIVSVNGEAVGQLRILEFEDPHMLSHIGYTLYFASQAALDRSSPAQNTTVVSESLESSNVVIPSEMVQMMMALRAYGANQQVIRSIDETFGRLIDQVGVPG